MLSVMANEVSRAQTWNRLSFQGFWIVVFELNVDGPEFRVTGFERPTIEGVSPVSEISRVLNSSFFSWVGLFEIAALIPVVDPIES